MLLAMAATVMILALKECKLHLLESIWDLWASGDLAYARRAIWGMSSPSTSGVSENIDKILI